MRLRRAYFIETNSCLSRPLGSTRPSRDCDAQLAQPDLVMCEAVPNPRIARIGPRRLATAWPSCGCLSRVALRLRTVPSEQRRSALSHHGLSYTLTPLSTIKRHDLQQFDRVPRSPRCLIRAYLIGANGCLPRPLGTTQPSRNCDHLLARPDLGDVQAGPNPWATRVRPQRPAEACQSCGCQPRVD